MSVPVRRVASVLSAALVVAVTAACGVPAADLARTPTHVIVASKDGSATFQVWRMRLDGTGRERLTADERFEHHWPRPSPDGRRILFYRAAPGRTVNEIDTNALWVMDADGTNARELIPRGGHGWTRQAHAEWSPDGRRIVMAAGAGELQLWTTDAEGRDPQLVVDRRNPLGALVTSIDPSFTPDGRGVVFTGCPRESTLCWWWDYEVFHVDLASGTETRLTFDSVPDFDPYVSPDGSTLVWLRCTGTFPTGPWGLYRARLDGRPLAPEPVVDDGQVNSNAMFSPDGSTLLFSRHVLGGPPVMQLTQVGVDGSNLQRVGPDAAVAVDEGSGAYWTEP
jgi:Tol biopolymer transport system component